MPKHQPPHKLIVKPKPITVKKALGTLGTPASKLNTRRGQAQAIAAALVKQQEGV